MAFLYFPTGREDGSILFLKNFPAGRNFSPLVAWQPLLHCSHTIIQSGTWHTTDSLLALLNRSYTHAQIKMKRKIVNTSSGSSLGFFLNMIWNIQYYCCQNLLQPMICWGSFFFSGPFPSGVSTTHHLPPSNPSLFIPLVSNQQTSRPLHHNIHNSPLGSSILSFLLPRYSLSLLCTRPNCLSLASLASSQKTSNIRHPSDGLLLYLDADAAEEKLDIFISATCSSASCLSFSSSL